jgi:HD superfamily phosphodiesterase
MPKEIRDMKEQHAKLIVAMTAYDHGDPMRIQHFMKVHDFASAIGVLEGLDRETLFVLETAAILHDIGIHLSEEKYDSSNGKYQETEGPEEARILMEHLGGYTTSRSKEYVISLDTTTPIMT